MKRPVLVVIQSRLASSRLPAKALLPLGGRATVVLCAQRAANTGLPVVVATSNERTDDAIATEVQRAGIACARGSHDDVLQRFAQATRELPDDAVVVRLTADNVFPDGAFLQSLLGEFERRGQSYLGTSSPLDGLPYGLSAEVFTAAVLRRADRVASSAHEREHVTPWIRQYAPSSPYRYPHAPAHWSRLRCTLDSFDDYERLLRIFEGIEDPVNAPWPLLVQRLAAGSRLGEAPRCAYITGADGRIHSQLTLGTVQFGVPYGVANRSGMPSDAEIESLLGEAIDAGITMLDTARAYGESEARIGRALSLGARERINVVTKLDVLDRYLPADADANAVRRGVDASIFASAHALRNRRLDTVLLHRWSHRQGFAGAAWQRLLELRDAGVIGRLGVSVSETQEALEALADPDIAHLQCSVNLIDPRWRNAEFLAAVRARPDVVIHARSVLLQGLLTLPASDPQWQRVPHVNAIELCDTLDHWQKELQRADRIDLCMAYVRGLPWVTSLVVGVERVDQLRQNLTLVERPALSADEIRRIDASLPPLPEDLLNPARWKPLHG